nr:MAG: RNA-dependent RNA polymerase [Crogonang virus 9]
MQYTTAEGNRYKYVSMCCPVSQLGPHFQEETKTSLNMVESDDSALNPQMGLFDAIGGAKETLDNVHHSVNKTGMVVNDVLEVLEKIERVLQLTSPDGPMVKNIIKRIESLLIMVLGLSQRRSLPEMLPDILQWLNANLPQHESVGQIVYKHIFELFTTHEEPPQIEEDPEWEPIEPVLYVQAGWFSDNWNTLLKGQFGIRLSNAMNLLVAIGLLPEKAETIMGKDFYRMFKVKAIAFGGLSIFEHLASTIDWVVDSIWPALVTQDWSYLLSSQEEHQLDELFRVSCNLVQLNMSGQFEKMRLQFGVHDEVEVVEFLMKTIAAHGYFKNSHDARLKQLITVRLIQLDRFIVDIEAAWHAAATREKPFAVLIRGPTSVGKSTLAGVVAHCINLTNGIKEGDQYTTTINGNDKYQSEFRTRHNTVIFDDMGNSKPERAEGNPLFILIQFINNMHCAALSPEAEKKGKNDIRCKTVIVTTNTSDLHAWYFSVNPTSVLRRFDLIIDVAMKPGTRDSEGKILEKYAGEAQPNIWDLKMSTIQVHNTGGLVDTHTEKLQVRGGIIELLEYLAAVTPKHYALQKKLVESSTRVFDRPHCDVPGHGIFTLPCVKCCLQPHGGFDTPDFDWVPDAAYRSQLDFRQWEHRVREEDDIVYEWQCKKEYDLKKLTHFYPIEATMGIKQRTEIALEAVKGTIRECHHKMRKHLSKHHVEYKMLTVVAGVVSTFFLMNKFFSRGQEVMEQGATLMEVKMHSTTPRMMANRDDKYQKVLKHKIVSTNQAVSTNVASFEEKLSKNMCILKVQCIDAVSRETIGLVRWCIITPISGGCWLAPWHMFSQVSDGTSYVIDICQKPKGFVGARRIHQMVNSANCTRVEGHDLCVLDLPGGSTYAFDKFYSETRDVRVGTDVVMYRLSKDTLESHLHESTPLGGECPVTFKITHVGLVAPNGIEPYEGIKYDLPFDSYPGLCGALIVLAGRNPMILGIHTAGNGRKGAACLLDRASVKISKELVIAETTEMPKMVMGKQFEINDHVHSHNAIHWVPNDEDVTLECIGEHNLATGTFSSDIIESPLCERLETIGIVRNHAGPERSAVKMARHKDLININRVRPPLNPLILKWAVDDIKTKLGNFMTATPQFKEHVHLLSFEDALNGVAGVKGFDPININTSMGFPLNQPKISFLKQSELSDKLGSPTMKYIREINNEDGTITYAYDIVFDADKMDIEQELNDLMAMAAEHKRPNLIFRANLKDEALSFEKIAKGKIRVFAGAPVTLVIATRMITLALINAMTYFPTVFESAVGVDAAGRDWDRLYTYITKFSHCCAGDFKAFDKVMPAGISEASFSVLKYLLAESGIPQDFLNVFDTLATEISHPIYEVDGLLYRACGSTPSGHPLTVVKNGIDNAISMRYAYYAAHYRHEQKDYDPKRGIIPLFHQVVALMTYGDDNVMSVDVAKEPLFHQLSIAQELGEIGQTYTSAAKGEHVSKYTNAEELDFLKRSFKPHPVFEKRVGALQESSIEKSLTCIRKPKKGQNESVAQILAGNMRQALFEYYMHSPERFRQRKTEFCEIVEGAKDAEGVRIDLYFVPPEEEECILRYVSSTCVYQQVMDDYDVPLEMQSGFMVQGCDMEAIKIGIQAKLNSWRTMRARKAVLHDQLLALWFSATSGEEFTLNAHWSVLTQRFETVCTMQAVDIVEKRRVLWQLDGLLNDDVVNVIVAYAQRSFCYRVIFDYTFGTVMELTSYLPRGELMSNPDWYASTYPELVRIELMDEVLFG